MAKRIIILAIFLIPCLPTTFAQSGWKTNGSTTTTLPLIDWSQGESSGSRYWYAKVLGQSDAGTFLLKSNLSLDSEEPGFRTRKFSIAFYDHNFIFRWEKPLAPSDKNGNVEKIFFDSDKVCLMYSVPGKSQEELIIMAETIDHKGQVPEAKKLFALRNVKRSSPVFFEYALSESRDVIGIYAHYFPKSTDSLPKNTGLIKVVLMDRSLATFYSPEMTMPQEEMNEAEAFFVGSDSTAYICYKALTPDKARFGVWALHGNRQVPETIKVDAPKDYANGYKFSLDEHNRKIDVAGFYSEHGHEGAAGTFITTVLLDGLRSGISRSQVFEESFLANFVGDPKSSDKTELLNYKVSSVVKRQDGGVVIIAEARYTTEYTYFDFFSKTYITRVVYHFDNIVAVSISRNGTMEWQKVIPKKQESQEDGGYYSSFTALVHGESIYFLYDLFEGKLTSVQVHRLDASGDEKHILLCSTAEDAACIPRSGKQVDSGEAIIPSFRKNKFILARVLF